MAATPVPLSHGQIHITVSIGMSCLTPALSAEDLVRAADAALYKAKKSGKNRGPLPRSLEKQPLG